MQRLARLFSAKIEIEIEIKKVISYKIVILDNITMV